MPKPIIIGVDPGTTSAFAALSKDGKLLKLFSSKNLGLNEMIKEISKIGIPILIGTDKSKVPEFIEKLSASFGCGVFTPKDDYKALDKKKVADKFSYKDTHQMDSLASAVFAYNSVSKLIEKVKLKNHEKEDELIVLVVKYGMSIRGGINFLEMPEKEKIKIKKVINRKEFSKNDYLSLLERYNDIQKELELVRGHSKKLLFENKRIEKELSKVKGKKNKIDVNRIDSLFMVKEKRLKEMQGKLDNKDIEINDLKESLKNMDKALLKVKDSYLLRSYSNLLNEINVNKDEMIYVENPNEYNTKVVDGLKGKIDVIVCCKSMNKKIGFHFVQIDKVEQIGSFVLVNRKKLDSLLDKKDVFNKIIKDYQQRI